MTSFKNQNSNSIYGCKKRKIRSYSYIPTKNEEIVYNLYPQGNKKSNQNETCGRALNRLTKITFK